MRLICPNCGAQYEVDARVIPDTGRDVQCSNCGHTWFQRPATLDPDLAEELGFETTQAEDVADVAEEPPVPSFDDEPEEDFAPDYAPEPEPEPEPEVAAIEEPVAPIEGHEDVAAPKTPTEAPLSEDEPVEDPADVPVSEPVTETAIKDVIYADETDDEDAYDEEPDLDEDEAPAPIDVAPQATLKDSVRDILRAEVEFDQAMRGGSAPSLETQPDLGLEDPDQDPSKKSLRDRMARLRGLDPSDPGIAAGSVAAASGKRRDLLPDIEEINSTLSAASDRNADGSVPDDETREERSGFRTGFFFLLVLVFLLLALYVFAPLIATKLPALAPVMKVYVAAANDFRAWLDQLLSGASMRLNGLLGQLNGG